MSKASETLCNKLKERGAQKRMAEKLSVFPSLLTRWKRADQKPNTAARVKMQRILRIPIGDWDVELNKESVA